MNGKNGEVINLITDKNGNPRQRKSGATIHQQVNSVNLKVRCHAYCQPDFCTFYGGSHVNCDSTSRVGVEISNHTVWASDQSLGPEWRDVTKGSILEGRTK